jgi:hypothetical protein
MTLRGTLRLLIVCYDGLRDQAGGWNGAIGF